MSSKNRAVTLVLEILPLLEARPMPGTDTRGMREKIAAGLLLELGIEPDISAFVTGKFIQARVRDDIYTDLPADIRSLFSFSPLSLFLHEMDSDEELITRAFSTLLYLMRSEYMLFHNMHVPGRPVPEDFPSFAASAVLNGLRKFLLDWYIEKREDCNRIIERIIDPMNKLFLGGSDPEG